MKALPSRWRRPGWRVPRWRPARRLSLPLTLGTTALLLAGPALLLRQLPRPQAFGLEKVMANVSLLQSFRATPQRPVPDLWRQRLGDPLATRVWRTQTRSWWQFWERSAPGQPFLAFSSRGLAPASLQTLPVPPLRVGDLLILPPDPLSRQLLSERLRLRVRPSPGVRLRCLPRLERDQAVFWRPTALGELLGPLAPFLQDVQEGCLTLAIQADGLTWTGEAASVEGMLLEAPTLGSDASAVPRLEPKADDPLLQVEGTSLERLLAGLLARELIRQPLAERWGFGKEQLAMLRRTPFRLVLRPVAKGPFQASMELSVRVGTKERQWRDVLLRLGRTLEKEGFVNAPANASASASAGSPGSEEPRLARLSPSATTSSSAADAPGSPNPAAGSPTEGRRSGSEGNAPKPSTLIPWPTARWARRDGVVVGGWQRRLMADGTTQISFFLGPKATQAPPLLLSTLPPRGGMRLTARPRELALRGLLPAGLPEVVQRSRWLWWQGEPFPGFGPEAPLSQLQGGVLLRP
jgi:hypothetical protein